MLQASGYDGSTVISVPDRQGPRVKHLTSEAAHEKTVIKITVRVILESLPFGADLAHGIVANVVFDDSHHTKGESELEYFCSSDGHAGGMLLSIGA